MESNRCVHISYVSGETLGLVSTRPKHEWVTFINALHYFAARRCDVPVWCVKQFAPVFDSTQDQCCYRVRYWLFKSIVVRSTSSAASWTIRCCKSWEDCEDVEQCSRATYSSMSTGNPERTGMSVILSSLADVLQNSHSIKKRYRQCNTSLPGIASRASRTFCAWYSMVR